MTIGDLIRPRGIFRDTGAQSREKERGWMSQEERRTTVLKGVGMKKGEREREEGRCVLGRRHETHGDRSLHK